MQSAVTYKVCVCHVKWPSDGTIDWFTAELDAKSVALESEESLEKSKATLLQAQVKKFIQFKIEYLSFSAEDWVITKSASNKGKRD